MSDIRFYHMERQSLDQILPQLLSKALQRGHRIVVRLSSEAEVERMNEHLWTYHPNEFLPHGSKKDGHEADQPIFLTADNDNPNNADLLILGGGAEAEDIGELKLVCDMLDGRDETAVKAARERWKIYKDAGHDVTYWQQSASGGWDKKSG